MPARIDDFDLIEDLRDARPRRRPGALMLSLLTWTIVVAAVGALVVFGLGPLTGRYRTLTVLSGSMRPTFAPGDVIFATRTTPDQVRVGDVIVFHEPVGDHHVTTHRVVKIYHGGDLPLVQTRGDANDADDPFELQIQGNELWVQHGHVPGVGFLIHALRTGMMRIVAFACIGLLALTTLWQIWFGGRERDHWTDDEAVDLA